MCLLIFHELLFVLLGQASEHQTKHSQVDHGLATTGQVLVVLTHATRAANPSESTLHDPAARQMTKAFGPFKQAIIDLLPMEDPHTTRTSRMTYHLHLPTP